MPINYIRDGLARRLGNPDERSRKYSSEEYFALRRRVLKKLVDEFGSSPAWITFFGTILSSVFFVSWLLALNFLSTSGRVNKVEASILEVLGDAGLPSMIAFYLILFIVTLVAYFAVATSVDQYKLRKGLDGGSVGEAAGASGSSNSEHAGVMGALPVLAPLRSAVYFGLNVGILAVFIRFSLSAVANMFCVTDSWLPSLILIIGLPTIAFYHVSSLKGEKRRLGEFWALIWSLIFSVVFFYLLSISEAVPEWEALAALIYSALMLFSLVWFATNGIAYWAVSKSAKMDKASRGGSAGDDVRPLNRWVFRDVATFGAMTFMELLPIFLLEVFGCRLLVGILEVLYALASLALNAA